MLGTYRLVLALLVALSHIGIAIAGFNPGVVAVVGFYLISGYVMTGLVRTHYARLEGVPGFYLDRALRLFPQYLAIAGVTFVWLTVTGTETEFLRVPPTARYIAENLLVVPINFNMFHDIKKFTLIPPAWSLGAEIQFYLLMPILLLFNLRNPAILFSVAVFVVAAFGIITTEWYAYRLLPGVLFIFMLGSLLYDLNKRADAGRYRALLIGGTVLAVVALWVILAYADKISLLYNRETLLGLATGIVILGVLARHKRQSWDEALGNLSYGVFLNHFFVKWAVFGGEVGSSVAAVSAFLATSILLAFVTYNTIERPVIALRRKLRTRSDLELAPQEPR